MNGLNGVAETCMEIERQFEEISDFAAEEINDPMEDREQEDLLPLVEEYEVHAMTLDRRFRVREMLVSMFSDGAFTDQSEWRLADTLSFREEDFGPADLFIYQSDIRGTTCILTLSGIDPAQETYSNLQEIHKHIIEHADAVGQEIADRQGSEGSDQPLDIDSSLVEGALVVANLDPQEAVAELDQVSEPLTSVWQFSGPDDERISVVSFDDTEDWDWHIPDNRLGTLLEQGQQYADQFQVSIDRFYDSHHELLIRQLPSYLHQKHPRSKEVWQCSENELTNFLTQSWSSPKRDEVRPRASALIDWWEHIGSLKKVKNNGGDHYHEQETVYSLSDYNGSKTDPSDVWDEVVKPY